MAAFADRGLRVALKPRWSCCGTNVCFLIMIKQPTRFEQVSFVSGGRKVVGRETSADYRCCRVV